jgi:hypothetical protein
MDVDNIDWKLDGRSKFTSLADMLPIRKLEMEHNLDQKMLHSYTYPQNQYNN